MDVELLVRVYQPRQIEVVESGLVKPLPEIPAHLSDYGVKTVSIRRDNREVELTLGLKAGKVNVYPRKDLSAKKHKTQGLSLVVAEEIACVDAKTGETLVSDTKPAQWWLLTSLPTENLAQVNKVVDFYALRWRVERLHYTLKSGALNVEKLQFDELHTLVKALSFYSVVAWQLLTLTYTLRENPEQLANQVFTPDEENTLNALMTEMDGFGSPTLRPVILLAATNLAEHLDEALRRRFDREPEVPPPDRAARAAYLRHELLNRQFSEISGAALDTIAQRSAGMTIADLRRIANEAAVMAARQGSPLTDALVEEAFEKFRLGEASQIPEAATLERIARHESGHALIGWLAGNPPLQVTIVGRGSTGGYVETESQEEKIIYTRTELEQMICQAMGGRAAELLYYGEAEGLSTGAASDLRSATLWAERMIREFWMSEELGQVFLDKRYLGEGLLAARVSDAAQRLVSAQLDRAREMLTTHRPSLERLSGELLNKNRLTRSDLDRILTPPADANRL